MVSNDTEGKAKIFTFDTYNFSAGGAVFIIKVCQLLDEGKKSEEIIKILEGLKGTQRVYLSVDTLEYLYKGGRISGAKQMISTIFNKSTEGIDDIENRIIVYGCGDNLEQGEMIEEKILATNCKHAYEIKAGACITAHSGPAIIGMAIL